VRRLVRFGVVAALVAAGCGAALAWQSAWAHPRASAAAHEIVFSANRMPSVSGEVYRVDPSGRRVDLSRSPFQDTQPAVSPDGRHVAFFREVGRTDSVWVVGIDGRAARRISAPSSIGLESYLAWAPDSKRLALVDGDGPISVLTLTGAQRSLGRLQFPVQVQWSPDGRLVTVGGRQTTAFHAGGGVDWSVPTTFGPLIGWSSRGLFAARTPGWITVYRESGRRLFKFRGTAGAWSPDGTLLASTYRDKLVVRTAGGHVVFRAGPAEGTPAWIGSTRVATTGTVFDLRTGKRSPTKLQAWEPRSADGLLVATTPRAGKSFALRVSRLDGAAAHTYSTVPGCFDDGVLEAAVESVQFAGPTRSLVYSSHCAEALDNLYTVAADGTGLRRLTSAQAEEVDPVTSPDGSRIAFSWAERTGLSCKGCPDSIRTVDAAGGSQRALTSTAEDFDVSPTWSPDGSELLFSRSSAISPGELMVVPAAGGAARDLKLVGSSPAWGPDRIAFVDQGLETAKPDGSDVEKVATGNVSSPAWSADGQLAYVLEPNVVVVGTTRVRLPVERISTLAWSPDGTRFVLVAYVKGQPTTDVYTVGTDGTGLRRLTRNLGVSSAR
jgi:Tol biopolymer transport system component